MERLSGQDATFLYTETSRTPFEIGTCLLLDTRGRAAGEEMRELLRDQLAARLHLAPRLRQKVVRVPFDLHHPVWVDDEDFDLDYHVRRLSVPAPSDWDQLIGQIDSILSQPLDHARPLWEAYLIDGLADGRSMLMIKTHHAAVDGLSGFELLTALVDLEAEPTPAAEIVRPWRPESAPGPLGLLLNAGVELAKQPLAVPLGLGRLVRDLATSVTSSRTPAEVLGASLAPPSPFNARLSNQRTIRLFQLPLAQMQEVKQAAGVKLNDVALALVGGGLRRYLTRRHRPTEPSLISYLPVTLRHGGESAGNRTSVVSVQVGTHLDDPVARLHSLAEQTSAAKARAAASAPPLILDVSSVTGPAVGAFLERLAVATRTTEILRLAGNLVISNVASIPVPIYSMGCAIESVYPIGPISDGVALNFTLLSYQDAVCFTMLTDPGVVDDGDDLVADCLDSWEELRLAVLG